MDAHYVQTLRLVEEPLGTAPRSHCFDDSRNRRREVKGARLLSHDFQQNCC